MMVPATVRGDDPIATGLGKFAGVFRCGLHQLCKTEVEHLGRPGVSHQHVGRLDVTMNDTYGVRSRAERLRFESRT